MKKDISQEIREKWISFFKSKDHYLIPRSNLIPIEDESLLFINSGVATLKKYFTGEKQPPSPRLVGIQPVARTNDVNSVGYTARHHTFFEMLGNFSIGDYFKEEAISYAWEFLTSKEFLNIKKELLYITVYQEDDEAYKIWKNHGITDNHLFKMGKDTNFWDMGIGPCGPSTEIFYDKGKKYSEKSAAELILKDQENDRFIEIWNIVFSEFNNDGKGNYQELPQKNIDTGAGLERIVSCLLDAPTNFESELFLPIIKEVEKYTNFRYTKFYNPQELREKFEESFEINANFKIIADFMRTLIFTINDGVIPGPNGRGYVIRKLLRKALLAAWNLKINNPFLYKLVDVTIATLNNFYQELNAKRVKIIELIQKEEEQFFITIKNSINQFNKEDLRNFDEKLAFKYYETYGLPLEFMNNIIKEKHLTIDSTKLEALYHQFQIKSKAGAKNTQALGLQKEQFLDYPPTDFEGYTHFLLKAKVLVAKNDYVIFDRTPFYATSGGQVSDIGTADEFTVSGVEKNAKNVYVHEILGNNFKIGQIVELSINQKRRKMIAIHHSSTHLLFKALEKTLQTTLLQAGSKVDQDSFRFDFNYQGKIAQEDLNKATKLANQWIKDPAPTKIEYMSIVDAKQMGATFLDGKKYGKTVRVVTLNPDVIDLCGGTHVPSLKEIQKIEIINFEKRGSGIYRIEAISTKNLIARREEKNNSLLFEAKLSEFQKEFNNIKAKKKYLPDFNSNALYQKLEKIKTIDKTSKNWNFKFETAVHKIEQFISKKLELAKYNLLSEIAAFTDKVQPEFGTFFAVENFEVGELTKDLLDLLRNKHDKVLFLLIKNKGKLTIMIINSDDFIQKNKLMEIIEKLKDLGFQGNGKNRLYMLGGKENLLDKLIKEFKIENH